MLKVAIVEENYTYAEYLKGLLQSWANHKTEIKVSNFAFGKNLLENSDNIPEYDIIFIDITQKQPDGFQTAERLRCQGYKNTLVFTADSGDRACEGYRVDAYRYYIKPLKINDVEECMSHALGRKNRDYFQYTYRGVTERLAFSDIVCFESIQHYIDVYTTDSVIHIKGSLKDIQKQCPADFLRCQRSYIINKNHIMSKTGNQLKLKTGKIVDFSPRYSDIIENAMRG